MNPDTGTKTPASFGDCNGEFELVRMNVKMLNEDFNQNWFRFLPF